MNINDAMKIAAQNATGLAREEVYEENLPQDLAVLLVDAKSEGGRMEADCRFQILGFVKNIDKTFFYTCNDRELKLSSVDWFAGSSNLRILDESCNPIGKTIKRALVRRVFRQSTNWFAVVTGNAVTVKSWLQERGYEDASAGSPVYVSVRPIKDGE